MPFAGHGAACDRPGAKKEEEVGTNYYMRTRSDTAAVPFEDKAVPQHEAFGSSGWGAGRAVHLCRHAHGWEMLFEANPLFRSLSDIRAFLADEANRKDWEVADEYGRQVNPEELFASAKERANRTDLHRWDESDLSFWRDSDGCAFTEREFF